MFNVHSVLFCYYGNIIVRSIVVTVEDFGPGIVTIRTTKCNYLVSEPGRCSVCVKYRQTLHAMLHRSGRQPDTVKCSPTNPTSSTNLSNLSTPQKVARFRRLHLSFKQSQYRLERLHAMLAEHVEKRSTVVDSDLHQDLLTIVHESSPQVLRVK